MIYEGEMEDERRARGEINGKDGAAGRLTRREEILGRRRRLGRKAEREKTRRRWIERAAPNDAPRQRLA